MDTHEPLLQAKHISKTFPGVKALQDVQIEINKGEIHALMGENGAGKSTLIKVLTGVFIPDEGSGEIRYNNQAIRPRTPEEAQKLGISTVYQEVNLCPNLTVAENIYIGREPMLLGMIDWKTMNRDAQELLTRLKINIDVTEQLAMYSIAIQQMVAIARAVDISAGLLILDEPTSSLDSNEVKELFQIMNRLKAEGMSIIFITHFIDQVYEVTDKITILRNGTYVGTYETKTLEYLDLVSKMIGREFKGLVRKASNEIVQNNNKTMLELKKFGRKGKISSVEFKLKEEEILGLAGLLGSGRTEIARLIFGIDKSDEGVIEINNHIFSTMFPQKAIELGMGFCPEDRKVEGIISELSVRENMVLGLQAKEGMFKFIPRKRQEEIARKYIGLLNIKVSSMEQPIEDLSGGNQQKVILGRWLATNPKLLILDEPTRGIDIGSRTEIQKLILNLAKEGMTILLISSELEEIVSICDRVIVLRDRHIIGEVEGAQLSEDAIMSEIAKGDGRDV